MIVADINHLDNCPHLKTIIQRVIDMDLINLPSGEHLLESRALFINRVSAKSREIAGSKSEIHRDYLDVHLVLSGKETLGYQVCPATEEFMTNNEFTNDCELVETLTGEQFLMIEPSQFVVFYPGIWHRPMLSFGELQQVEKVVIKIQKDYLNSFLL
ncbi:YhcH/YjgK/YiaL family protein [Aeromonas veronii]